MSLTVGANHQDAPLLGPTPDDVAALGLLPRVSIVHFYRGYDVKPTRTLLDVPCRGGAIALRGVPAPIRAGQRWVVKRTQPWLNGCSTLRRCMEKSATAVDVFLFPDFRMRRHTMLHPRAAHPMS